MSLKHDKKKFVKNGAMSVARRLTFTVHRSPFAVLCLLLTAFCFLLTSCQPDQRILNSQNSGEARATANSANSAAPVNDFERDIKSMQTANFDFIYVFRRKDGGKISPEDGKFAKANSPFETNRFIISDEGRVIIAGSNTRFAPANLEALKSGFVVADFSKPESELKNANANINQNK